MVAEHHSKPEAAIRKCCYSAGSLIVMLRCGRAILLRGEIYLDGLFAIDLRRGGVESDLHIFPRVILNLSWTGKEIAGDHGTIHSLA
jgi:hypothetical protein